MHALNIRMLEHTYGSLENCPPTINGRILEKDSGSMTEELRKRLRYLQHLPVTCQFEVAEIQLSDSIVSRETLQYFHGKINKTSYRVFVLIFRILDQIEIRKKRRNKRAREEKRREKLIAEAENRMMGKYPEANIKIDSHYQFPEFDGTGFEATLGPELGASPKNEFVNINSPCSSTSGSMEHEYNGMSFAKVINTT